MNTYYKHRPRPKKPLRVIHDINELPVICNAAEAGLLIRQYPEAVCRMARNGVLPGFKQGQAWFFKRDDLQRYLDTLAEEAKNA